MNPRMHRGDAAQRSVLPHPGVAMAAAMVLAVLAAAVVSVRGSSGFVALVIAAMCALVLASALLAFRVTRTHLASLELLARSAREISTGPPGGRLPTVRRPRALRELVRELNALLQRLGDSVQAQAHFAGNVAHEFRTPVSTLLADVQLMKLGPGGREELRDFLDRTENELRHLGQLVESFLILSRIEAGERRRDLVHVGDVVRRACERCREAARRGSNRVDVRCPETTAASDPFVWGDAELLQALVENLIRNAIQHSPAGERVSVTTGRSRGMVQISVSDRGSGIPAGFREAVFFRGVRSPDLRPDQEGFGLGLSIASSVARLHDGRIRLEQNEAGGCTFLVDLPAMQGERSATME